MAAHPQSVLDLVSLRGLAGWNRSLALRVLAVLTGIVIPLLFIGRGAAAIMVPIVGGLALLLIRWPELRQRLSAWKSDSLALAVGAMLIAWLVSVSISIKPGFSLTIWLQAAGLLMLIAVLPRLLAETPDNLKLVLRTFIAASFVGTTVAVISIYLWPPLLSYMRPVETPFSYQAAQRLKSYAAVMPCLAPVALWAGMRLRGAWLALAVASVLLGILVVAGTQNRAAIGGYLGAASIVVLAFALRHMRSTYRMPVIAAIVALLAISGALVIAGLPKMPFDGSETPKLPTWLVDAHRQVIWGFVWDRALERPWFGWGPSTANFLPGADDTIPGFGQTFVPLHAHNWLIQLFSDVGVVGLATAVIALAIFFKRLTTAAWREGAAGWAALSLAGAFFVSMLANFSLWQSWWQAVLVTLVSICLAGARPPHGSAADRRQGTVTGR